MCKMQWLGWDAELSIWQSRFRNLANTEASRGAVPVPVANIHPSKPALSQQVLDIRGFDAPNKKVHLSLQCYWHGGRGGAPEG